MEMEQPHMPSDQGKCSLCGKIFKDVHIRWHQENCQDYPDRRLTPIESYRFCLLNEEIFQHILSFMSTQTLVKL